MLLAYGNAIDLYIGSLASRLAELFFLLIIYLQIFLSAFTGDNDIVYNEQFVSPFGRGWEWVYPEYAPPLPLQLKAMKAQPTQEEFVTSFPAYSNPGPKPASGRELQHSHLGTEEWSGADRRIQAKSSD